MLGLWCALAALAAAAALPPCTSDEDCSLNGVCDVASGACACDRPWAGSSPAGELPDCALLAFRPAPVNECGPACVFHGMLNNWTSWGMSVLRDARTGMLDGFVAEMADGCNLGAWTKGSQVVHVSSASPTGVFARGDIVVPPWSHNPEAIRAPDGEIVIFTLGDGWPQNGTPDNCTSGQKYPTNRGQVSNCTPVASPSHCVPGPCLACNITVHHAADAAAPGPWEPVSAQIVGISSADSLGNWNPSPFLLTNGSIALMIHTDDNGGWSGEAIAIGATWRGPFVVTVPDGAFANVNHTEEDPFMWVDKRGHWHYIMHRMFDPGPDACGEWSGGHSFSADGTSWSPVRRPRGAARARRVWRAATRPPPSPLPPHSTADPARVQHDRRARGRRLLHLPAPRAAQALD
jgi:hypothetical protein